MPATRLARAITSQDPQFQRGEEQLVGATMAGLLKSARPIVCPPEQLNAVPDDVFPDLGAAFEYGRLARLPFEEVFFDFFDHMGRAPAIALHFVADGGHDLGFELRGVLVGENHEEETTVFLPIIGYHGSPPEELGAVFIDRSLEGKMEAAARPKRWVEKLDPPGGQQIEVTMTSVSAAMAALGETPRAVPGAVMGAARAGNGGDIADQYQHALGVAAAVAVRMTLKVIYLLDSVNVELAPATVSRQVRRQAERTGTELAWVISVRAPRRQERDGGESASRSYSHRFEVRGNFAHHREGSWLYERSTPADIRPCPRCGECRRVWREPHIKGPADKPLAIKVRRIDFDE
jgi:hypothetical protein